MSDRVGPQADPAPDASAAGWIVFTLAGERFGLPIASVEAIASPPPVARVPHAAPALLGAGHLGGQIVPIVDLARLLGLDSSGPGYDGTGEVVRLRVAGGSVGLWVEKVERVVSFGADPEGRPDFLDQRHIRLIDPAALLAAGLDDAPAMAAVARMPVGEVAERVAAAPASAPAQSFIVVETGGEPVALPRDAVLELVDEVAWTPVPRAPDGLIGVGVLRGAALPVVSLAVLLGLDDGTPPAGFAAIDVGGRRALLAVERIVGLRFRSVGEEAVEPLDVAAAIPAELRRIILGFPPTADEVRTGDAATLGDTGAYLAFTIDGRDCAVAAASVDRIVGPQNLIKLPCPHGTQRDGEAGLPELEGAIELRGQIVPVAALRSRLGLAPAADRDGPPQPNAYVILRDAAGLGAIGVDQAKQLVRLRPADIVPTPADERSAIAGVAPWGEGRLLCIIAADRLWSGA